MKVIDRYQLEEVVGAGSYGKVYRATTTDNAETVAIKCIPIEKFKKIRKLNEFTENEIKVLESIQHPNIVKYVEKLLTRNNTYMVYEFCNNGTLESKIYAKGHLSESQSLKYFSEILSALCLLNSYKVLHRDIKPQNIMLNNDDIKVGDFGFCKPMENYGFSQTMVGSPIYMAPEILKSQSYDDKADVWSLGVCLYEMLFGRCPYEERTIPSLIALFDSKPLPIPREINNISKEMENLIRMLLVIDPRRRASFSQAQEYLSSFCEYSLHLKKKYNEGIPPSSNLVQKPTKHIANDPEPIDSKAYSNTQQQYIKTVTQDNVKAKPMPNKLTPNNTQKEISPIAQYNNYNNTKPYNDPIQKTNTRDHEFYKQIPPTVFVKPNKQQIEVPVTEIRQEPMPSTSNRDKRPISPLRFNTIKALNLNKKEDSTSLHSYNSNLDKDRTPKSTTPKGQTNTINYKSGEDHLQRNTPQERSPSMSIPKFLIKLSQMNNRSYFGNELLKLSIKTLEDKKNANPNEVQQLFAKRSKYLILIHNIKQLWNFEVENEEENKLLVVLLILKKIHYLSLEIKISLSSLNNTLLDRYLVDTDNFKKTLNVEIEEFNKLYEDLVYSIKQYSENDKPDFQLLSAEINKYDFDQQIFKNYLVKFIEIAKKQNNCDKLFIERYLCNILDSLLIDEILDNFGIIVGALENHRYIEIMQKINFDELKLINEEKISIIT